MTLLKSVIASPLLTRVTKVLLVVHLLLVRVLTSQLHKALQSPLLRLTVPSLPTRSVTEVFASVVVIQATSADSALLILVISKLVKVIVQKMYNFVLMIKKHENLCVVAQSIVALFQPSVETQAVAV